MLTSNDNCGINDSSVNDLKSEVEYRTKLQDICNKIYAASNLDEILVNLKNEITSLFDAERITVYVVDGKTRELVSRFKSGTEISEIRIPVSISSLAGYAAFKQKLLNVKNVYDDNELASIDRELKFDKRWDKKTGFVTKQVLAFPIIYKKYLLGVIQLINRKDGSSFMRIDEQAVDELSKILGIALYNQKRMAKSRTTKFDYLLENHILTQKELEKAIGDARQRKELVENILISDLKIPKKEVGKSLSEFYKVPYAEYNPTFPIPGDLLAGLRIPFMRNNLWVPIRREGENIMIAIDNPHDIQKIDDIKTLFIGKSLVFSVALKQDILDFIKLFTQDEKELAGIDDILSKLQEESEEIVEAESSVGEEDSAVVQLVNKIILDAYARRASDIHIEPYPGKNNTHVRIRIDGQCALYQTIPFSYKNAIVSRIKIMSDLDIAERRKPQDGKIKFKKFGGKDIELRVATVPTQGGLEDIVMRILAAGEPLPLDKMGFSEKNFENFVSAISKPYGIMFVCGPTGSGKTTTLHSALGYINKPETKIWTAEDPVEITQKGLRQVQVKPKIGFDFAAAMRSFLRADPDVIMVGEMRDKETTHIGIEASLTGHLVLSTLHTNSAPESITRLLDMGMDPFNFADAILCILAQRLVRTLCKDCKQPYTPSRQEYDEIVREYGEEPFEKNMNIPYTDDLLFYKPGSCEACNKTGYKGRMGIHELLMGTDEMKRLIQSMAKMEQLREQAIKDGMTTLKQDGIEKVFGGYTDFIQVRKVCIK
ncbi:MAG: Flp pilus assembly complex ATPase component TadA [Proteobacteria bacterium]|nr:Flp pilus assembly complex ATPase component TadA [Pseudomonadota bacterium]MBU1712177.1 Flp pilus assembly complex ATPase component TadA [Pseudomonadota bacterium]